MDIEKEIKEVEKNNESRARGWEITESGTKFSKVHPVPIKEQMYVGLVVDSEGRQFLLFQDAWVLECSSVMYQIDTLNNLDYVDDVFKFEEYLEENKAEIALYAKTRAVYDLEKEEKETRNISLLVLVAFIILVLVVAA